MSNHRNTRRSLSRRFMAHPAAPSLITLVIALVLVAIGASWSVYRYNAGDTVCYDSGVSLVCTRK